MNTIKKTTLVAVITAMAAIAVPAMASAATWKPVNTNKTLISTNNTTYATNVAGPAYFDFVCSGSTLGTHVRLPLSSTLDITSASYTGCVGGPNTVYPCHGNPVTVTATGLPWAATSTVNGVSYTEHLDVTYSPACVGGVGTFTVDGPVVGTYNNATHTLTSHAGTGMFVNFMGTPYAAIGTIPTLGAWHETTNTLTLT